MIDINNSIGKIEDKNKNTKKFFLNFSCNNELNIAITASFYSFNYSVPDIIDK